MPSARRKLPPAQPLKQKLRRWSVSKKKSQLIPVDPVFDEYGPPFIVNKKGKVSLNDRALAVKCATLHQVRYDAGTEHYERYDVGRGLWVPLHQVEVVRMLDNLLIQLGHAHKQQWLVQGIGAAKLGAV